MENNEHILAKADIHRTGSTISRFTTTIYLLILAITLVIGINNGTGVYSTIYSYNRFIGWFGFEFYRYTGATLGTGTGYTYNGAIVLVIVIYVVMLCIPLIVAAIFKRQCKLNALTITDSRVYGSYNNFLTKNSINMPIEKIDNLTITSGLMDKFRSGVTLGVCSTSGIIKLHFVQNADEVIAAAIGRIEEIKEKEKSAKVVVQPAVTNAAPSVSEKLKELVSMKEQGLITEEEFNKKREEILSKM